MTENEKYFNAYLDKIIKYTGKTIEDIRSKRKQLSLFKMTATEQQALEYSEVRLGKLLDLLNQRKAMSS